MNDEDRERSRFLDLIHTLLLIKEIEREKKRCQNVMRYHRLSLGRTSNFNVTSLNVPDVQRGVGLLTQLRVGCLPTMSKRRIALNAQHIPHHLQEGICPCCNELMDPHFEEWSHIVLNCSAMNDIRAETIGPTILSLMEYLDEEMVVDDEHLYVLLQGGILRERLKPSKLPHSIDLVFSYEVSEYGGTSLTNWINGFGHIPHLYPPGFDAHGYKPMTEFLQQAVPRFTASLYHEGKSPTTSRELCPNRAFPTEGLVGAPPTLSTSGGSIKARPKGMPKSLPATGMG